MAEYTPVGRPQSFTLPDLEDSADLIVILQDFAGDTMNAKGDTVTGDFTITGTVDASTLRQGGVAVVTSSGTVELTNKTLGSGSSIKAGTTLINNGTISGGVINGTTMQQGGVAVVTVSGTQTLTNKTLDSPTFTGTISGLPSANVEFVAKTATFTISDTSAQNKFVLMTQTADANIVLPSDATAGYDVGSTIGVVVLGSTGVVAFTAGSGATVNGTPGLKLRARYSQAVALKVSANTWVVSGDVIA